MTRAPSLAEDMHVHSTFSDGEGTIEENIAAAEERSLTALTCVDHVRRDTDWHPGFVEEVRRARRRRGGRVKAARHQRRPRLPR